jgi:DNA-directed RNA polymerase omega subunit
MNELTDIPETSEQPAAPVEPPPPIQSRFLFVDIAALRAKQLRRGARVRFEAEGAHKAERVAMEEVRRGLVYYNVPRVRGAGESSAQDPGATPQGAA